MELKELNRSKATTSQASLATLLVIDIVGHSKQYIFLFLMEQMRMELNENFLQNI